MNSKLKDFFTIIAMFGGSFLFLVLIISSLAYIRDRYVEHKSILANADYFKKQYDFTQQNLTGFVQSMDESGVGSLKTFSSIGLDGKVSTSTIISFKKGCGLTNVDDFASGTKIIEGSDVTFQSIDPYTNLKNGGTIHMIKCLK